MTDDHRSIVRRSTVPSSVSSPVVTPIFPSVVYASADADSLDDQYEGRSQGFTYAREGHPNARVLAEKIDQLEGVVGGLITNSGMAALSALFLGLLRAGDHIVAGDQLYGRCLRLLTTDLPRLGFEASLADATDASAIEAALRPNTRMILVEVVSNPTLRVADITGIARVARERGILLAVDNTFTTPLAYRPFEHGADLVVHSVTKMLAGHSDVTLGYIAARHEELADPLRDTVISWGFCASPFDCWLAERGMHSLELRLARAQSNAKAIADRLATLDGVERVLYPGRSDHPDHARAREMFGDDGGAMVAFSLAGGREAANRFLRAAAHIPFAPTLGDIATTTSHPPSSSHRGLTAAEREALGIGEGFIRLSVGIEDQALLEAEITAAVQSARA